MEGTAVPSVHAPDRSVLVPAIANLLLHDVIHKQA